MLLDRFGIWVTISRFFCFSNRVDSVRLWQCRPRMTFVSRLLKFAPSKSVLKHLTIQNDHFRVTYRVLLYIILIKLQTKNYHNDNKLPGRVIFLVIVRILRLVHTCSVTCVQFENIRTCVKKSTKPQLKPIISPFNISFYQIVKNTQYHRFPGQL